jgi:hypothetical protein
LVWMAAVVKESVQPAIPFVCAGRRAGWRRWLVRAKRMGRMAALPLLLLLLLVFPLWLLVGLLRGRRGAGLWSVNCGMGLV